jgi:hypothetical protein
LNLFSQKFLKFFGYTNGKKLPRVEKEEMDPIYHESDEYICLDCMIRVYGLYTAVNYWDEIEEKLIVYCYNCHITRNDRKNDIEWVYGVKRYFGPRA